MEKKGTQWVIEDPLEKGCYWPSEELKKNAIFNKPEIYDLAAKDPIAWWASLAKEGIYWDTPWAEDYKEDSQGKFEWFVGGKLNVSYNILEKHLAKKDKVAIYWEPEELVNSMPREITYLELFKQVNNFACVLKANGIKKGDCVCIFLPTIPEVIIAMLACSRIGAVHAIVFSAFSKLALNERLLSSKAKLLITADGYYRRGKEIKLKAVADDSLANTEIETVIVVRRTGKKIEMKEGRDIWWDEAMKRAGHFCEPEKMSSQDPLFVLYTSGTTGKPKGIVHTTGGYAVGAYWTTKINFNLHDDDVVFCTADIGWITGHTYNCYGPLLNGSTIVLYDGAPDFPTFDRWYSIMEKYKATIIYTAPTAIRMLKKQGIIFPKSHDLSSLRILGSVGEPLNEEAWIWYFDVIGQRRCPIIDTWWQTETGTHMISALPGIGPFISGFAGRPFPGVSVEIANGHSDIENGMLTIKHPFPPSLFKEVSNDPGKYQEKFYKSFEEFKYLTNDGAIYLEQHGNIKLTGRLDDIMKVAGHAISTAELENALCKSKNVVEAAVIPIKNELKYEAPLAFVILEPGIKGGAELEAILKKSIDELVGLIARPEKIIFVEDLPRTRSGKIVRRILKEIVGKQQIGDLSSLANPESVEQIKVYLSN